MATSPLRDELVSTGEIHLHCVQWGEQGPPIVCIHGLTANAFCFQAFADELAANHRVIAYDLRGRGESDRPDEGYSIPLHAMDLAKLIDALGIERPVLIGHSLGALIALYFAAHYPEKLSKLVLVDAGAPLAWKTLEEQPAWLTASVARVGIPVSSFEEYKARLQAAPFLGSYWNEYLDIYLEHDVSRNSDGSVVAKASRTAIYEENMNFNLVLPEQQWANVLAPTLLLRAGQALFFDNDQLLSLDAAKAICQGIAGCHYVNFPKLNHYTIIFGTESGPAQEIQKFINKE